MLSFGFFSSLILIDSSKKRGATLNDPSTINPNLNMKKPTLQR